MRKNTIVSQFMTLFMALLYRVSSLSPILFRTVVLFCCNKKAGQNLSSQQHQVEEIVAQGHNGQPFCFARKWIAQDNHLGASQSEHAKSTNRPLLSSKNSHFQNEARCTTFFVKMSFICTVMKMISISKAEHLPSFLKQRPGGTRKWPIGLIFTKNII